MMPRFDPGSFLHSETPLPIRPCPHNCLLLVNSQNGLISNTKPGTVQHLNIIFTVHDFILELTWRALKPSLYQLVGEYIDLVVLTFVGWKI
jgi:hypothetical protein